MKLNTIQDLNFQKKLVASVRKPNCAQNYNIYKLDKDDKFYFYDIRPYWQDSLLFLDFIDAFDERYGAYDFYVLENDKKECLACAQTLDSSEGETELICIESQPDVAYKNKDRKVKYIGETMIAFLLKMSDKNNKKEFIVPHMLSTAAPFYIENCGFKMYDKSGFMASHKTNEEYQKLISQNEAHTGAKIELIG